MEVKGKVIAVTAEESGVSRNGNEWKKKGFVIEQPGQYITKAYFTLLNQRIDICPNVGDDVLVFFDVESREYNGKWYSDLRAYKVEQLQQQAQQQAQPTRQQMLDMMMQAQPKQETQADIQPQPSGANDLPF